MHDERVVSWSPGCVQDVFRSDVQDAETVRLLKKVASLSRGGCKPKRLVVKGVVR